MIEFIVTFLIGGIAGYGLRIITKDKQIKQGSGSGGSSERDNNGKENQFK